MGKMKAAMSRIKAILTMAGMHILAVWARLKGGPNRKKFAEVVDSLFLDMDKPDSPGCALAVFKGDKIFYSKGYGMADMENKIPITPQTIFNIGSNSKQFTAFSIYLLADEGKLSLDDDIRKYLPEMPDYRHKITIDHLIHHTSGLRSFESLNVIAGKKVLAGTAAEALAMTVRQKELNFTPSDEHLYCNTGYFLMSLIVERVSGMPYPKFAQERIFGPLGMKHTRVRGDSQEPIPLLADGHIGKPREKLTRTVTGGEGGSGCVGAGEILTCVEDMLFWHLNFRNRIVGSPRVFKWMKTPARLNNGKKLAYAGGLIRHTESGVLIYAHGGGLPGWLSQFMRVPVLDIGVACFSNCDSVDPFGRAGKVVYAYAGRQKKEGPPQEKKEEKPAPEAPEFLSVPAEELTKRAGLYQQEGVEGEFWLLVPEEGKLAVKAQWGGFSMGPVEAGVFRGAEYPDSFFHFDLDEKGRPTGFREMQKGKQVKRFLFLEREVSGPLEDFAGAYWSDELEVEYGVKVEDGKLVVVPPEVTDEVVKGILIEKTLSDRILRHLGEERFQIWTGLRMQFERDDAGKVSAMALHVLGSGSRARRIRFTKKPQ